MLQKIRDGFLVVDRAPYHIVLTYEARPASSKLKKTELADWLEAHESVPDFWEDD